MLNTITAIKTPTFYDYIKDIGTKHGYILSFCRLLRPLNYLVPFRLKNVEVKAIFEVKLRKFELINYFILYVMFTNEHLIRVGYNSENLQGIN